MSEQNIEQAPFFEIKGKIMITEGNDCDFELDPSIVIPDGAQPFIGEFLFEKNGKEYRRIDMFAVENSLTQDDISEQLKNKGDAAADYLLNINNITFIRKDFLQ